MKTIKKAFTLAASVLCSLAMINATTPTELLRLCRSDNNLARVQQIIREEPELINSRPVSGGIVEAIHTTPLITTITYGATETALALIQAGADIHAVGSPGESVLSTTLYHANPRVLRDLLAKNIEVPIQFRGGIFNNNKTPLELAEMGKRTAYGQARRDSDEVIQILNEYYNNRNNIQSQAALTQPAAQTQPLHERLAGRREREETVQVGPQTPTREEARELQGTDKCSICLEAFNAKDDGAVTVFTCSHALHTTCYEGLKQANTNAPCPECRAQLRVVCKANLR